MLKNAITAIATVVLAACAGVALLGYHSETVAGLEHELESTRIELEQVQDGVADILDRARLVQRQRDALEQLQTFSDQQLADMRADLAEARREFADLAKRLAELQRARTGTENLSALVDQMTEDRRFLRRKLDDANEELERLRAGRE